jgi:hypothetical protein
MLSAKESKKLDILYGLAKEKPKWLRLPPGIKENLVAFAGAFCIMIVIVGIIGVIFNIFTK